MMAESEEVLEVMEHHFVEDGDYKTRNAITIKKYKSTKSGLSVYFCNVESQIIQGYFAYGIDKPEAAGIESLLGHLDSSGGLLPRPMRGEMLRPVWMFHGAENPLADRDQSCYVCCALGETAFLGTFSCCVYLLQNIEAVFESQGLLQAGSGTGDDEEDAGNVPEMLNEVDGEAGGEPKLNSREFYCLTEAGEGAMAWEATLQEMFPGVPPFWNRLLFEAKGKMTPTMRACYDTFYRPENLTVVIAGTIEDHSQILETLGEYESDYEAMQPNAPEFTRPWTAEPLPEFRCGVETNVKFISRNLARKPNATICFGWRGCPSTDIETAFALKVLTAHISVGPLWNKFITPAIAQRISWCLLEYVDTCALVTIHGMKSIEDIETVSVAVKQMISELSEEGNELLQLQEIQAMTERVGWHCVRELESEPALVLASCITKAELYGNGEPDQVKKRLEPTGIFEELAKKPLSFWKDLLKKYFISHGTFVTKIIPRNFDGNTEEVDKATLGEEGFQSEAASSFSSISRKASSRPRSRANNAMGEEGFCLDEEIVKADPNLKSTQPATELEKSIQSLSLGAKGDGGEDLNEIGFIKRIYKENAGHFPFGDYSEAAAEFEVRLATTKMFLEEVIKCDIRNYPMSQYRTDGTTQHPKFSLAELPFYTFLDDTPSSFVYLTSVMDTSHLNETERNHVAIIASALGAVFCPRPPGLDTDMEITDPNEFHPPLLISDSQVSLGLNGEMMQHIFSTLIARPEHYKWAVGMIDFVFYKYQFTPKFLTFVCEEAAKNLAYNYRMQTVDKPNYEYFDSAEINLYSLIKLIYKPKSNARLFVGRRRLDLINEFLKALAADPEGTTKLVTATWRKIVDSGKISFQIACDVDEIADKQDPIEPWKEYFTGIKKSRAFNDSRPTMERDMITAPNSAAGIAVSVKHGRPACITLAIPIDPTDAYFPALCVSMQLFSMAHKWIWQCMDEEEPGQPAIRMPCSFANIVTLNLDSADIVGALKIMQHIMRDDWEWLNSLLIATKLMLVNDPTTSEMGPQGAIALTLLTNLAGQPVGVRRDLMIKCLKVTLEDIKFVIKTHLSRLFNPQQAWCSLMAEKEELPKLIERLGQEFGLKFKVENLTELCSTL